MIKNKTDLLSNDLSKSSFNLRKTAITALEKIIKALRPENLIKNNVRLKSSTLFVQNSSFDLIKVNKIYIIGGGKATLEMVCAFEQNILKNINNPYKGIINIPKNQKDKEYGLSEKIIVNYASHPVPDKNGVKGVKAMLNMVEGAKQNDLIISFISGGGSSLLPLPRESISLKDLKRVNSLLLASGASIHEINAIRKHLSGFKGGNLAKRIHKSSGAT
ncbi:MAG: DUF4147 domain-containing protein, partial [Candidatus Lokiarchaeota archaeon]|nr:DUF4147 domain-containing protein [Candidatus Lokiarchaeota archaeon]MBD3341087.1 DUF4147 domain-containing protein [Candidatus Lokiarchaeota archaeon]